MIGSNTSIVSESYKQAPLRDTLENPEGNHAFGIFIIFYAKKDHKIDSKSVIIDVLWHFV